MTQRDSEMHVPCYRPLTRRLMMAGAAAVTFAAASSSAKEATDALIALAAEKNAAFMNGEMDRWLRLVRIAQDFTLMEPFGGPASHGFDASPEKMLNRAAYFQNADTELEVEATYASDEIIVLVMIERQRGEVGGMAKQDWSLRVTEVYRKDESGWALVHRHADPLVRRLTLDQAAALARGLPANK